MPYVAKKISRSPEESISIGEGIDRTYTERYDVTLDLSESDSAKISAIQVYNGIVGLPRYGQPWVSPDGLVVDSLATVRSFSARRDHNNKTQFQFNFTYSPRGSGRAVDPTRPENRFEGSGGTDDLSKLLPVWSIDFEDRFVPFRKDLDEQKTQNSAGDQLDPLPTKNDPVMVVNYSSYLSGFDTSIIAAELYRLKLYKFSVNEDNFLFYDPDNGYTDADIAKWCCWSISIHPELIGMNRAFRQDLVLKYSSTGWTDDYLDAGLCELITPSGAKNDVNRRRIMSPKTRQPVTRPWPLDASGVAITDFDAGLENTLQFRNKYYRQFSNLGVRLI